MTHSLVSMLALYTALIREYEDLLVTPLTSIYRNFDKLKVQLRAPYAERPLSKTKMYWDLRSKKTTCGSRAIDVVTSVNGGCDL